MLSRRNIRIKVMQLLYAAEKDSALTINDLLARYKSYSKKTTELYLFNLHYLSELCRYSVRDEVIRRAKLRPTEEDLLFSPKLFQNPALRSLILSEKYLKAMKLYPIAARVDEDMVRLFYQEWIKTEEYKVYFEKKEPTDSENVQVLLDMYKFLQTHENFNELVEDDFNTWIDDKTLIVGTVKKTLKGLPNLDELVTEYGDEDELTLRFGEQLIFKTYQNNVALLEEIKPMLQNWDAERVATVDMILIKLALAELLYFPTIPTKVTINEYVDLSKSYSTDKSKEFVNGLMDRLMKKLKESGSIKKEGRGLMD